MKIIDLANKSNGFAERHIREYCGGRTIQSRWTNLLNKGVGGLTFIDSEAREENKKHRVIISFFNDGLGFYFRNIYRNRLILLKTEQIKSIEIVKNQDIIRPFSFSLFSILASAGVRYSTASAYLTPREIIKEEKATCTFRTDEHFFNFVLEKTTPEKLASGFKNSPIAHLLKENIHSPKIIKK